MDFKKLRKEYETDGFDSTDLPDDPIAAFRIWFDNATQSCPETWFEPNAMALSTADAGSEVACRWVLLKGVTETGIRFYTNYDSDKGRQIASNPHAAAAFHWPYLGRQVRFQGAIEKTSRAVSEEYFHSRPRGSQIGAMVSQQSSEIDSRQTLEDRQRALEKKFEGQEIPHCPKTGAATKLLPSEWNSGRED